jgi:hypothetical protein
MLLSGVTGPVLFPAERLPFPGTPFHAERPLFSETPHQMVFRLGRS